MAEKIAFKNETISKFQGLVTYLDLNHGLGHTAYRRTSLIDGRPLPTCRISLKSKKLFVDGRKDEQTYLQKNGDLRPTLLGRLTRVDLKCCLR